MSIGKRIRKRRQELKLTQGDLARALGLTPQHISGVEQDKRSPSLASLAKLAEELGITVDCLVTGAVPNNLIPTPQTKTDQLNHRQIFIPYTLFHVYYNLAGVLRLRIEKTKRLYV